MDDQAIRAAAMIAAAMATAGLDPGATPPDLIAYANQLVPYVTGPGTASQIAVLAFIDDSEVIMTTPPGGTMPQVVNATDDNTTVVLTATGQDDHNQPTSDQLTFANDDTSATPVASWVQSGNTYTGTLNHIEGTVNVTITDPTVPSLAPTVVQVVVGPGETTQVNVTATVT